MTIRGCDLDLYDLGFLSAPPNASRRCAVANEQGGTSRESMNALSRSTDSVCNTTLFLIGGWYTSRATAAEAKGVELDFVQLSWPDAEGPDKKVSRHTGCPATQGWTLSCLVSLGLTRTEYVQLVGQSCAERHLKTLVAKYDTRSKYMDECKRAGLHPETGLPLTQKDGEETPWLFPDVHKTGDINIASSKNADDDTDMDSPEPAIDDGDGSFVSAFDKKRASLPTSVGSDEDY
jgi:hypothetical protein